MTRGFLVCHLSKCQQQKYFLLTFKNIFQKYYFVIWYTFKLGSPQVILKSHENINSPHTDAKKKFSEYALLLLDQ